jgi:hypothetical protein
MLSLSLNKLLVVVAVNCGGASPIYTGPCTLVRTWGTRLGLLLNEFYYDTGSAGPSMAQ